MNPEYQVIFNLLMSVGVGVVGWFARVLWEAVGELRKDLHTLEVELPRNYVPKGEFAQGMADIKEGLNRILDRLDAKQDKGPH